MRIILTHEQADFDALASLLGAALLQDSDIPVLPRRLNRNVRAFLTLYGADLPLVDPRDLPAGVVEHVTLVDTQSLVTLRGMNSATAVYVIDHHPLRLDLDPAWQVTTAATGANTTLLVERLRERETPLGVLPATLLLLGIYEDTGSLTYDRTTTRDLLAAAHLLEQGASLSLARGFLNHPLSPAQQEIYDRLRRSLESFSIHGHTVLVACGEALESEEELSSIAHKLRDLLDPDALFVLVSTHGGVQMILRSTSANIDVAEIAAHFGGGGHERAAAGLVHERSLEDVRAELVRLLPEMVKPAATVAEIMSRGPQLLSPDTPVEEAARRMQRYGYEGYPVVSQGRLVGLLTRRAVDRAMAHNMKVNISSLMDAGSYTVRPDDSIEHLQRVMTGSNWGQIPVIGPLDGDSDEGRIIGIVTRTDLIKTFAPRPRPAGRLNLAERLERSLPPARLELLKTVAGVAHQQRVALFIVGGFVRDLLLNRPGLDFDLVVEGEAIALARVLAARFGGRVTSHSRFGTAKWRLPSGEVEALDFVSARTEFYTHPSALPTVERGSIKLDLHRRDFTINTLAMRLDGSAYGELYDYWGGLLDLRGGFVRVLHSLSFVDDPTRILRAVRFEQRFGFQIESRTLELIGEAVPLLARISGDRLRHELDHILVEERAAAMLGRLQGLGLLEAIHPDLVWDEWYSRMVENAAACQVPAGWQAGSAPDRRELCYILWLLRLSPAQAAGVATRLKFSAALVRTIRAARQVWEQRAALPDLSPGAAMAVLEDAPPAALLAVYCASDDPRLRAVLDASQVHWRHVHPGIDGHELRRRGLPPGPYYRSLLSGLRTAWLNGEVSTPVEEEALLERLLVQYPPDPD